MQDRRRHDRYALESEITYTIHPTFLNEVFSGSTRNCSQSGLCIRTSNPITVGQEITVKGTEKCCIGRVVWLKKTVEDDFVYYDAGVKTVISYEIQKPDYISGTLNQAISNSAVLL